MFTHLASHHGIGRFYKCLFCDYEMYRKEALFNHIYSVHKADPVITSMEAIREIIFADSFPFVMRDGSGGGIGDVAAAPSSTETQGGRMKRARFNNSSSSSSSSFAIAASEVGIVDVSPQDSSSPSVLLHTGDAHQSPFALSLHTNVVQADAPQGFPPQF